MQKRSMDKVTEIITRMAMVVGLAQIAATIILVAVATA